MWSFISSAIGALAQNANTQNAINANKESQAENREWNLNLAKMQNQWSIDQWNRENSYNSPAAYRARLKAAGMNPDLAYGGVTGQSAASPAMTSGQGSQPVDNSLLAQKMTAMNIASVALDNKLKAAQIQGVKEENKGKSLDNRLKSREVSTEDALSMLLGSSLGSDTQMMASKLPFRAYQEYMRLVREETDQSNAVADNDLKLLDKRSKQLDNYIKQESAQSLIDEIKQKLRISKNEAEFLTKTLALRIQGFEDEQTVKRFDAIMSDPDLLEQLPSGFPAVVKLLRLILGK